jgi:2-polyprenyl-3-methyl-5-hydroxy-6-metoxy-1,4-benzoquinol methylase
MDNVTLTKKVLEQNKAVHAREAPIYEIIHPQVFNWYHTRKIWKDLKTIFKEFVAKTPIDILDAGCGTGFITKKLLLFPNVRITAADLSNEMIEKLKLALSPSQKQKVRFVNNEIYQFLNMENNKYHIITCSALLHHLVDYSSVVSQFVDHLLPGGILFIAYEPLKQPIRKGLRYYLHRFVRIIDMHLFVRNIQNKGISLHHDHESSLADYQTTLGGIEPERITEILMNRGVILDSPKFATRASGILAFISDRIIHSQNTFSIIFKKT